MRHEIDITPNVLAFLKRHNPKTDFERDIKRRDGDKEAARVRLSKPGYGKPGPAQPTLVYPWFLMDVFSVPAARR